MLKLTTSLSRTSRDALQLAAYSDADFADDKPTASRSPQNGAPEWDGSVVVRQ